VSGIGGLIGTQVFLDKNPKILSDMASIQNTEEFYIKKKYIDNNIGIQIAWTNFYSCVHQEMPIWDKQKNVALIFIGEDYGIDESEKCIGEQNNNYDKNDLEYLVRQYKTKGLDFIRDINGWFCGVLIDYRSKEVHLFNDQFGIKRIYYHHSNDAFYFSSEAKCLLKVLPKLRSIDNEGLGEYFSLGCTLHNKTIFKGISILPAGSIWTFSFGMIIKKRRFRELLIPESEGTFDTQSLFGSLKEALPKIMRRYYRRDEKVAVSLTGGLDTRLIMAWAKFPPYKVPCYTFSGIYRDCYDAKIGAKISAICQQHHMIIRITRRFFSEFPALAKKVVMYADGTMDVSGAAELFVLRQAREIAPVRLTGNYGDQILRGVVGFRSKPLDELVFNRDFVKFVNTGAETYKTLKTHRHLDFFIDYQLPYHHYPRLALEQTQVLMRTPFLDKDLLEILCKLKSNELVTVALTLELIHEANPDLARIPTDRGKQYPRLPIITFLRSAIRECLYKVEYAYDYGMPSWLTKIDKSMKRLHIQKLFLGRQKYYHFRTWYKSELSSYVKEILLSSRSLGRPYLNKSYIVNIIKDHMEGRSNYTREIHFLLTCELLQRYLIESI